MIPDSAALIHHLCLNKVVRISLMLILAVVVPILVYLIIFARVIGPLDEYPVQTATCSQLSELRIRCGENLTEHQCVDRGCCHSQKYGCYHFMPAKHQFYILREDKSVEAPGADTSTVAGRHFYSLAPLSPTSAYGFPMNGRLYCEINEISPHRVQIMVRNAAPEATAGATGGGGHAATTRTDTEYSVEVASPVFYLSVYRRADRKLILSTQRGAFAVSLNYFEWNFYLGTHILIGLGRLRLTPGFRRTVITTGAQPHLPFILAYDAENQKYHGIYWSSPYPVEVEITDSFLVILRGVYDNESFAMDLIIAEELETLQQQLLELIGYRPRAANSLQYGLHICDTEALFGGDYFGIVNDLEQYLQPTVLQTLPFDSHCLTERLTALNAGIPDEFLPLFARFKASNKAVVLTIVLRLRCESTDDDCAFWGEQFSGATFQSADDNKPHRTRIGGQDYLYLDWASSSMALLFEHNGLLNRTVESLKLGFDGLFLQGNFLQDDNTLDDRFGVTVTDSFPYLSEDFSEVTKGLASPWLRRTSSSEASGTTEEILRKYNLYPAESVRFVGEQIQIHKELGDPLLLWSGESSTNPNINTILRGIHASWEALHNIKAEILAGSLTGLHSINSNVCGDMGSGKLNEELCLRWYQLSSLSSNYRVLTTATPIRFSKFYQRLITDVTWTRYALSSYFLTMRQLYPYRAINVPLYYDYPDTNRDDMDITSEWMVVGRSLFAAPVLSPTQHVLDITLPSEAFELRDGLRIGRNSTVVLSVVQSDLPIFIKSGHIVPMHVVNTTSVTVNEARYDDLLLVVALPPYMATTPATLVDENGDGAETESDEEIAPIARGSLALNEQTVIEFIAIQNGSWVSVASRGGGVDCQSAIEMSSAVSSLNIFGVQFETVTEEDDGGQGYGSLLCRMEQPVDLCVEDLSVAIDIGNSGGNGDVSEDNVTCELIRY